MRKRIAGKRLSRPQDERRALLRSLLEALFTYDSVKTTLAKAKAVRPLAEKLITKALKKDNASYARIQSFLFKRETVQRLTNEIAPRFVLRPGGYTRIIKLGPRRSDFSEMAILELVEKPQNKLKTQNSKLKSDERLEKTKAQESSRESEILEKDNAKDNNLTFKS